ncbi:hypothetical protein [Kribbella sp. NPDC048915]|uniref:hypothetical protein n=1 Tax=Kribbella sp. NPDC048915 TaxID=3155148 RepID=UPI00340BA740
MIAVDQRFGGTAAKPITRWTGILLEEPDPGFLGTAGDDGSISVSVVNVLEPLRRARDLDRPLTVGEAIELRDAIGTLTHEAVHLMTEFGDATAPDAYPYDSAAEADNEGRTEYWTHLNLDDVILDVFPDAGLDHVVDAVQSQTTIDAYPAYTPAVRAIDQALAERSGLTSEQVTQKLLLADDAQRWNVAVDLVIDARLVKPGLMPERDRDDVRRELVAPLRQAMSGLEAVESSDLLEDDEKSLASSEAAQHAIAGLDAALDRVERRYRTGLAQRSRQHALDAENQGAQLSPELQQLRAVTGGSAPAGEAVKGQTDPAARGPRTKGPRHRQGDRGLSGP